ncbi:MAG: tetratricopeptide repeat protein [Nitrospirae bacterium]|nr:tetratricopeptide repeat protein [Nitrospirota bacterium]
MVRLQKTKTLIVVLLALITFLVYLPSLQNEFVNWDDDHYVYENPHIQTFNLQFFRWAFFKFNIANWHPLTWISHAIDYAVWGLNPLGHHLTNNILHAINTLIVVLLVVRLLGVVRIKGMGNSHSEFLTERGALITGVTTGLLFGLHPIHVESVAWVSERKDVLCALFFLLSVMSYLKYVAIADNQKKFFNKRYLFTFGFFILALLSKPMAVTLPAILLILDWYPFQRIRSEKILKTIFIEKLPFFAMSLASAAITILAQRSAKAIASMETITFSTRVIVSTKALVSYLWKMLLPVNLNPFYPYPKDVSLLSFKYLLPILLVIGITITCIVVLKKQRLWLAVWSYYVITLLPVIGIIQVGNQSMADRYTYLPSLGPFLIVGLGTMWSLGKIVFKKQSQIVSAVSIVVTILLVILVSYRTGEHIGIWKDSFTLWNYIIVKEPQRVPFAYLNRGTAFEKTGQYDKAIEDYNMAIILKPDYFEAYNNRGLGNGKTGLFGKAIEDFSKAIAINSKFDEAYNNRGVAYYLINEHNKAFEDFKKAIELNQNNAEAYVNRGYVYLQKGIKEFAVLDFEKGCALGNQNGCKAFQDLLRK